MELRFNFERSLQAAAYLLHLEEGKMPYIRLLRLLYIAERELLAEDATPLTGDTYKAMPFGPVLGHVYDLIKGYGDRSTDWEKHVRRVGYCVKIIDDPGRGKLPRSVVDKLNEVSARYIEKDHWEVSDLTHDFPEWAKNYPGNGGSGLIPLEEILEAQKADRGTLEVIAEAEVTRDHMAKLFGNRKPKGHEGRVETAP